MLFTYASLKATVPVFVYQYQLAILHKQLCKTQNATNVSNMAFLRGTLARVSEKVRRLCVCWNE